MLFLYQYYVYYCYYSYYCNDHCCDCDVIHIHIYIHMYTVFLRLTLCGIILFLRLSMFQGKLWRRHQRFAWCLTAWWHRCRPGGGKFHGTWDDIKMTQDDRFDSTQIHIRLRVPGFFYMYDDSIDIFVMDLGINPGPRCGICHDLINQNGYQNGYLQGGFPG